MAHGDETATGLAPSDVASPIRAVVKRHRNIKVLLDHGYELTSVTGFDMFPQTPHVETVAVFDK